MKNIRLRSSGNRQKLLSLNRIEGKTKRIGRRRIGSKELLIRVAEGGEAQITGVGEEAIEGIVEEASMIGAEVVTTGEGSEPEDQKFLNY